MSDQNVIRIAQVGWNHLEAAESVEATGAGIRVPWIEVNGTRLPAEVIAGVKVEMADEHFTAPTVALIGRVEIVYTDEQGIELPPYGGPS
jgi:hypothetical protein